MSFKFNEELSDKVEAASMKFYLSWQDFGAKRFMWLARSFHFSLAPTRIMILIGVREL